MPVLDRHRHRDNEDLEDDEDEDEEGLEGDYSRANSPTMGRHGSARSRPGSQWGQMSRPGSAVRPGSGRPGSRLGSAGQRSRSLPRPTSSTKLSNGYTVVCSS